MNASARALDVYRQTEVRSRSPLELVVMLYDGALRFLAEAQAAEARKDLHDRARAVSRALAIVCELQNTLNIKEGGDVAAQLDALYGYITSRLLDSTAKRDAAALDEAHRLLSTVREAWTQVATQEAAPAMAAAR